MTIPFQMCLSHLFFSFSACCDGDRHIMSSSKWVCPTVNALIILAIIICTLVYASIVDHGNSSYLSNAPTKSASGTTIQSETSADSVQYDEYIYDEKTVFVRATLEEVAKQYTECPCCQCKHKEARFSPCYTDLLDLDDPSDLAFLYFYEVKL